MENLFNNIETGLPFSLVISILTLMDMGISNLIFPVELNGAGYVLYRINFVIGVYMFSPDFKTEFVTTKIL